MTTFAATRAATSSVSQGRSAQWFTSRVASVGSSVVQAFRSFGAASDLQRGTNGRALTMLMVGRD
jgi:hypothetical protein